METNAMPKSVEPGEIELRRAQLIKELESLEKSLEGDIDDIKEGLQQKTDPRHWIRRYPLAALGIAVGVGIIVGSAGSNRRGSVGDANPGTASGPTLLGEMKRALLNRGMAMAAAAAEDYLVQRLAAKADRQDD